VVLSGYCLYLGDPLTWIDEGGMGALSWRPDGRSASFFKPDEILHGQHNDTQLVLLGFTLVMLSNLRFVVGYARAIRKLKSR
jgi:hypothetical protein